MIQQSSSQLVDLLRNLTIEWDELQPIWDDSVRRIFDQQYIEPLQKQIAGMRNVMESLGHAIEDAKAVIEER